MNEETNAALPLEDPQSTPGPLCEVSAPHSAEEANPPLEAAEASPAAPACPDTLAPEPGGDDREASPGTDLPTPPAGDSSSPAAPLTPEEKEARDQAMFERQERILTEELERLNRTLYRVKDEKREADKSFNAEIKSYEDSIEKVLVRLDETRQAFAAKNAPPPPGALPFEEPHDEPDEPEGETEAEKEEAPDGFACQEEPWLEICQACGGTGRIVDDECHACGGAGKVVPQPPKPALTICRNCGHPAAAHFTPDGASRSCNVKVEETEEGKAFNCACNNWEEGPANEA